MTRFVLSGMRRAGLCAGLQTWTVPSSSVPRLQVLATPHPLAAVKCHVWSAKQRKTVAVHGKGGTGLV